MYSSTFDKVLRAMQTAVCIALFVSFLTDIKGQEASKPDSILLADIFELIDKEEHQKALDEVNLLSEGMVKKKNWKGLLECQNILFRIGYFGNLPQRVLPVLKKNHALFPEDQIIAKTKSTFFLASTEDESGNTLKSMRHYQRIIRPLQSQNNLSLLQGVYNDLGITYTQLGDYARAEKYTRASIDLNLQQKDSLGYSYNIYNLALNQYFQGDFQKSEKLFREYLSMYPEYAYDVSFYLSKNKLAQKNTDSAKFYFTKAQNLDLHNSIPKMKFNELYSDILCEEGKLNEALICLQRNEVEVERSANSRFKAKYYYKLADLYSKKNDLENAEHYFDYSLKIFTNNQIDISTVQKLSDKSHLFHEIWLGDILIGLAKLENARSKFNSDPKARERTALYINLTLQALDFKRSFFEDIESSIISNKRSKGLYEMAIEIYLEWYEEDNNINFLDEAFQIAQKFNGFVLRQQVNERLLFDRHRVSDTLKRQFLDQKLIILEKGLQLGNNSSREEFEILKREEAKLDSIKKIIDNHYPHIKNHVYDFNVSTAKQIQQSLKKNQAVIKYFEGKSKLFSFVLTKNKIWYFVHPNITFVQDRIKKLREILSDFRYHNTNTDMNLIEKELLNISFQLSEEVILKEIESLPKEIKKLIIIPTGSLTKIPFESLIIKQKESWNDHTQYLINKFAISYNYICNAIVSSQVSKALRNFLSYGLEYDEFTLSFVKKTSNDSISKQIREKFRSAEMGHLYFADDEAEEVAKLFNGKSYTNSSATKENFLSNVDNFDIVHLSAHSYVDFQYPHNSAIIFSKKDSTTDNLLRVKDIDRLSFDGQLFTLSACNTFYGKNNEGEGLSSMARSFIQSGAGSVVGSLWSVPDEISKSFMLRFYSKLKDGLPKDVALQETKLDFMTDDNLSSPLYRSPAYWSAWVIYGDTRNIYRSTNEMIYLWIGLACFCFLLLVKNRMSG